MRIGIHNEPAGSSPGGGEILVAVLAEALSRLHSTEIVHHRSTLTREALERLSATRLADVSLRHVPPIHDLAAGVRNPFRLRRARKAWQEALVRPYDVFVTSTHGPPPPCPPGRGALIVLFPLPLPSRWLGRLYRWLWDPDWRERVANYPVCLSISEFTRTWTRRRWGRDSQVIPPPVDVAFDRVTKENLILSIGRFAVEGHCKNQHLMMSVFRGLVGDGLRGWEYLTVGGLGPAAGDWGYFERVRGDAEGAPARVVANAERSFVRSACERARIFWHAAGHGDGLPPEKMEHFGIVTVEAMAAGCVPVVPNRGGQPELVDHGVTGFLWETPEEMAALTRRLVADPVMCDRMGEAARAAAARYSRDRVVAEYLAAMQPLLR